MKTAYYNENDPFAAAWLRELINNGLIADGEVDERSIVDVQGSDLKGFTQCHYFAGIGGWSYALRLAGWPDDRPVWTGSCPCQPFSSAGKGRGTADERHLWPEFFRLIKECRPATVFGEQVASKAGLGWLDGVQADLEGAGYASGAADLCAAGINAPHIRQRLFWVADSQDAYGRREAVPNNSRRGAEEARGPGLTSVGLGEPGYAGWSGGDQATATNGHGCTAQPAGGLFGGLANASCSGVPISQYEGDCGASPEARGDGSQRQRVRPNAGDERGLCGVAQGDTNGGELAIGQEQSARQEQPALARASGYDLIRCVEPTKEPGRYVEKWRRVEPGTLPLAHGIPGRVGRLRGYGNAIVPQVAAEFVGAYMETT